MFGTYIWMLRCTSTCSIHNLHSWSIRCPRDGLFVPRPSGLQFPEPLSRDVDYLFGTNEFNGRIPDMFKICAPHWRFGFVWWNLRSHPEKNPMVDHQFASQKWQFRGLCRIIPFIQTSTFDESLIFLESSHKVVGVGLHLVGHLHWKDARRQDFCWWILAQIWSLVESQGFPHMNFQQIWAVTKTPFLALFVEYDTGF